MNANNQEALNNQRQHWDNMYVCNQEMFGTKPSESAIKAAELFKESGVKAILELGAGQGRDTMFFAECGFMVYALDYSDKGVQAIEEKAKALGLSDKVVAIKHDMREALPFEDNFFDACYSHMFFCMALMTEELEYVSSEIARILKPKGINIYTTRSTNDAHYETGIHRGDDMYEVNGFIVHFFSMEKVQHLAQGFRLEEVSEFEEGELPRRLYYVVMRSE